MNTVARVGATGTDHGRLYAALNHGLKVMIGHAPRPALPSSEEIPFLAFAPDSSYYVELDHRLENAERDAFTRELVEVTDFSSYIANLVCRDELAAIDVVRDRCTGLVPADIAAELVRILFVGDKIAPTSHLADAHDAEFVVACSTLIDARNADRNDHNDNSHAVAIMLCQWAARRAVGSGAELILGAEYFDTNRYAAMTFFGQGALCGVPECAAQLGMQLNAGDFDISMSDDDFSELQDRLFLHDTSRVGCMYFLAKYCIAVCDIGVDAAKKMYAILHYSGLRGSLLTVASLTLSRFINK